MGSGSHSSASTAACGPAHGPWGVFRIGWGGDICVERSNKHDPSHNQLPLTQAPPT